jgi:hypothetical protein
MLGVRFALQTAVAELCEVCWRQHPHKCLLALSCCLFWLRPALWLMAARARKRRLARPTYSVSADQGDFTIWPASRKIVKSVLSGCRYVLINHGEWARRRGRMTSGLLAATLWTM